MLAKEERRATEIVNTASVCDVCSQRCCWHCWAQDALSLAAVGRGAQETFCLPGRNPPWCCWALSWVFPAQALSALPDIARTWKPCSLPLITVLANAVILQNVTITCLCYLQGGFILCLHLENALLADLYFSPWSIPSNLKNNSLIYSAVSSWQRKEEILPCVHALCMKCNYSTLNVIGALGSSCEEFSCILSDSKGRLIT